MPNQTSNQIPVPYPIPPPRPPVSSYDPFPCHILIRVLDLVRFDLEHCRDLCIAFVDFCLDLV